MASLVAATALLAWRQQQLQRGGEASALDWLLDLGGGIPWQRLQQLRLRPEQHVALQRPLDELEGLWNRHLLRAEPLQYLLGRCPWRDMELQVQPGVLIPRQETELLIELAQERCNGTLFDGGAPWSWADLGCGSGCLSLALARLWPQSHGHAVDISDAALEQTQHNLKAAGLLGRVALHRGNWWQPLRGQWGQLQLVVCNPPYIPTAVWHRLDAVVKDHEPELALHGGADGLDAIRLIAADAQEALAPGGWLFIEHHHDQSRAVLNLLEAAGLQQVTAHQDLEGMWRFASARAASER